MANEIRFGIRADDQVSGKLAKIHDSFDRLGKSKGFQSVAQGVGIGVGINAWNLFSRGISTATDFVGDSVRAFAEEEQSLAKLNTSLAANVRGWDGNIEAIEAVLSARMALGFADDDQRQSLATLTAATHDVTKALNIQRTAMDLARFRQLDLGSATDILTKVYAGNVGILSRYGIVVRKGSDATEALAQIQAAAAGQAEAYANTLQGKATIAQIKFNEAQEKFGEVAAPLAAAALSGLADVLDDVAAKVSLVTDDSKSLEDRIKDFTIATVRGLNPALADMAQRVLDAQKSIELHDRSLARWRASSSASGRSLDGLGEDAEDAEGKIKDLNTETNILVDTLIERLYGDVIRAGEKAELKKRIDEVTAKIREQEVEARRTGQTNTRELTILRGQLAETQGRYVELLVTAAKLGKKPESQELVQYLATLKTRGDHIFDGLLADITRISSFSGRLPGGTKLYLLQHLQHGGPVMAGQPYVVGERRPELFVPNENGRVLPRVPAAASQINVTFQSLVVPSPAQMQQAARALVPELTREMRRVGALA